MLKERVKAEKIMNVASLRIVEQCKKPDRSWQEMVTNMEPQAKVWHL